MAKQVDVRWISEAITKGTRTENFCVSGTLPAHGVGLTVAAVGEIELRLQLKVAKQLISVSKVAPYGKGAKTLVNKNVRNSFELDAKVLDFSVSWRKPADEATEAVVDSIFARWRTMLESSISLSTVLGRKRATR